MRILSKLLLLALIVLVYVRCDYKQEDDIVDTSFKTAIPLYNNLLKVTDTNFVDYPHSLTPDGKLKYLQIDEWTGGFWPGILWYMYEYTNDDYWKEKATIWTES